MNEPFVNARTRAGYSQDDMAWKLGIEQSSVAYWETGKNLPRFKHVIGKIRKIITAAIALTTMRIDGR